MRWTLTAARGGSFNILLHVFVYGFVSAFMILNL